MPHKAFFVQGMAVLCANRPSDAEVRAALKRLGDVKAREADPASPLCNSTTFRVPYRPDVNGYTFVDYVDKPWPDSMGNPKGSKDEQMTFAAWSMGWFGFGAWPGMMEIAQQLAGAAGHDGCRAAARQHRGFLRVLTSYAMGIEDDAPVHPPERDARDEFDHAMRVVEALLQVPGTLAYFNPNGAQLLTEVKLMELREQLNADVAPVPLGCAARVFNLGGEEGKFLVDLASLNQFRDDVPDIAAEGDGRFDVGDVVMMVYNTAIYLVEAGPVIEDGHTIDGPGGRWRATLTEEPPSPPARSTLVFRPDDKPKGIAGKLFGLFRRK